MQLQLNLQSKACLTFSLCVRDFLSELFVWECLYGEAQALLYREEEMRKRGDRRE
jgi:hypothetical protein